MAKKTVKSRAAQKAKPKKSSRTSKTSQAGEKAKAVVRTGKPAVAVRKTDKGKKAVAVSKAPAAQIAPSKPAGETPAVQADKQAGKSPAPQTGKQADKMPSLQAGKVAGRVSKPQGTKGGHVGLPLSATPDRSVKPAAADSSESRRASLKRNGNNGLLPKIPIRPGLLMKNGKPRKTYLKPEELEEFRQMLFEKRRELVGDIGHLHSEARHQGSSGETNSESSMPIHMADIGSDTWEQELTIGLIENEQGLIREIDEALDRIDDKTYGICLATNRPIAKARLRARPWAKYCIEYARQHELGFA